MAGRTDPAAGPAGGSADTAAAPVGDRAAAVCSAVAVVGSHDPLSETAGSGIPTVALVEALGVPVPCRGQAARREDSLPGSHRATALAELSPAQLCPMKMNAVVADVMARGIPGQVCPSGACPHGSHPALLAHPLTRAGEPQRPI